ncbi:HAMP domain-containing sensor histidine kinase [Pelagibius sp. CAU 1746]|uniref:sensor histidine kinase n=1 Tax=Pelagibius sp. CAU 1746 TaxID=3140370 RepID=UPI00325BF1B2
MDPFLIIKALNVAVLVIIGGALFGFWRSADRTPWLLHWSAYEFALAVAVIVDRNMLPASLAVGVAVPLLLLGIFGYRKKVRPPRYTFLLLFAAIALPGYGLAEVLGKTEGYVYLSACIAAGYLAAAAMFIREGGGLNMLIAGAFLGRTASILLYPLWEAFGMVYAAYAIGQVFTLAAGVGMLMAGFAKAYNALKKHEQELIQSYNNSEELMLRLERRNQEYLEARQNAEAANTAKSQFLANMSHELRTPLNAILGFSEVLAVLPREQAIHKMADYARNIHEAASGLQAIISDILNLSRVEAGALDVQRGECDLSGMFADLQRILRPLADEKQISLVIESGDACLGLCDERLTRQILINGLSNAIKYTQRGGRVVCRTDIDGPWAVATVEDNGIGIDDERIAKVFEPFWQEGNNFLAENQGVGLGLTIARSYAQAQDGKIEIKRAAAGGTVFRLYLPAKIAKTEFTHATPPKSAVS